jgi:membrane-associated phospholipid phosphatase
MDMKKYNPLSNSLKRSFFLSALLISGLNPATHAKDNVVKLGNALEYAIPLAAAGVSWVRDDKDGFWQLAKSEITTGVITAGLKASIHSQRPNGEDDKSFPSGHASITFTAAHYLQKRYGYEYGIPAYLASSFVGYSRVHGDEHHWRDVIAGAAIGIASAHYFTDSKTSQISLQPIGKTIWMSYRTVW